MTAVRAITFDYFGTLVDVGRGAAEGMAKVLDAVGCIDLDPRQTYLAWDQVSVQLYRCGPYRKYREVAVDAMMSCLSGFLATMPPRAAIAALTEMFLDALAERSPPQPEVPAVLDGLARRGFTLMPITNMDTDLWARTTLAEYFPQVTTAEMAQAYKPSERIFRLALERLALPLESVLHVAVSPWADIEGAKPLGLKVAWINRTKEALGPWTPRPDYECSDLTGLNPILTD